MSLAVSGSVAGKQQSIECSAAALPKVLRAPSGTHEGATRPRHLHATAFRCAGLRYDLGKSTTPKDINVHSGFGTILSQRLDRRGHGQQRSWMIVGLLDTIVDRVLLAAQVQIDNDAA
ncbi:MAG TPA: hypothetical protein VL133_08355 [Devosia sp.]|nr:hypothetical protein [Devosia sp.]